MEPDEGESTASWSEKDRDGECKGTITLTKVEPTRLTFSLGDDEGDCVPGTIWLTLKDDTLVYRWRDVDAWGLYPHQGGHPREELTPEHSGFPGQNPSTSDAPK